MTSNSPWDLTDCVQRLLMFRDARDWQRFHNPKDLAAALAIEAAELQEIFLWKPAAPDDEVRQDPQVVARAKEEMADCAIFLLLMAHGLQVDLASAIGEKIEANESRYGVDDHRGVARKAPHDKPGQT